MSLSGPRTLRQPRPPLNLARFVLCLAAVALLSSFATAKETPVTAIVLFDGPSGPAYVQITGLLLNGKSELRVCDGVPSMNKTAYETMLRVQLAAGTSLERTSTTCPDHAPSSLHTATACHVFFSLHRFRLPRFDGHHGPSEQLLHA